MKILHEHNSKLVAEENIRKGYHPERDIREDPMYKCLLDLVVGITEAAALEVEKNQRLEKLKDETTN